MKILWIDDEIEGFRPHLKFLEREGVIVKTADHPEHALKILRKETFDLVLLDYRMPGLNGLETLKRIKRISPNIPVALVSMISDKDVIEETIAEDIFDYIIKPIKPTQILALIKRLEADKLKEKLKGKKISERYFEILELPENFDGWVRKGEVLLSWKAETPEDETLIEELSTQNNAFAKWIVDNYSDLFTENYLRSYNLLEKEVFPLLEAGEKVAFFVFDSFRFDQFLHFAKLFPGSIKVEVKPYMGILPTATVYARNAIFAGKTPIDIYRIHPEWLSNNRHEMELLRENLISHGLGNIEFNFQKINSQTQLKSLKTKDAQFEVFVLNFLDLISHLRQEVEALKDIAGDEASFIRWCNFILKDAELDTFFRSLIDKGYTIFATTDHGWVEVKHPVIIIGGEDLTQGLRFKFGDSARVRDRGAFMVYKLSDWKLPSIKTKSRLAITYEYYFLVYPSDPNVYKKIYEGGIFHGGITLEELILPVLKLSS